MTRAPLSPPDIEGYPSKARRGAVNSKAIRRTRRGKGVDLQLTTTRGSRSLRKKRSREGRGGNEEEEEEEKEEGKGRKIKLNCPMRESTYFIAYGPSKNAGLIYIHTHMVHGRLDVFASLLS